MRDVHPFLINNDIWLFLKHGLSELARRVESLDILCRKASRLFVHAAAKVKFLDNKDRFSKRRPEVIVGLPESTYYSGKTRFDSNTALGSPYTLILEVASSEGDLEVHSKITSTVGAVVLLVSPLPSPGIADLLVWIARRPHYPCIGSIVACAR